MLSLRWALRGCARATRVLSARGRTSRSRAETVTDLSCSKESRQSGTPHAAIGRPRGLHHCVESLYVPYLWLHVFCRTLLPCIGTCELMAPPGGTIRLAVLMAFSVLSRGSTRHRGCAVRRARRWASSTPRRARDPPVDDRKMS